MKGGMTKKGPQMEAFFRAYTWRLGHVHKAVSFDIKSFSALFGEHVSTLVLNETIEVQAGDAFSDSGLSHAQGYIAFNALPEVSLKCGQTNVFLLFALVLLNDIENHKVVLVHGVNRSRFRERFIPFPSAK